MNAFLLYPNQEWSYPERYFDEKSIIQDLGLKTVFLAAAKEIMKEDGKVKLIQDADPALEDAMKKVMMVPLKTGEEIYYRQEILRDCLEQEGFIRKLYDLSAQILCDWDKLGRKAGQKSGAGTPRTLVTQIHVLRLFVKGLSKLKALFEEYEESLISKGLRAFGQRLREEYSDEMEAALRKILADVEFYANEKEHTEPGNSRIVNKARIVVGCGVKEGLKLGDLRLEEVKTGTKRYRDPNAGLLGRAQEMLGSRMKNSVCIQRETALCAQAEQLEYEVARYLVSSCRPFFDAFFEFFDQLHFQVSFYRGALNLKGYMERFHLPVCYPTVGDGKRLCFQDLKEFVMSIEQKIEPVGNTCDIVGKKLLIVTGANQGGKSTFLRSIGIGQIMLQCGLNVAAKSFESGIYPSFFTHFTRREDSAMNSGRLDEELGRMSQIVDNLEPGAMVLLNESFASTTEKEGSVAAYDIVKALTEAGVMILTVTHLLSFAQKMYREAEEGDCSDIEFLSAQRMEGGRRTFKMIEHAPEFTSFGLDLYDEIIGNA